MAGRADPYSIDGFPNLTDPRAMRSARWRRRTSPASRVDRAPRTATPSRARESRGQHFPSPHGSTRKSQHCPSGESPTGSTRKPPTCPTGSFARSSTGPCPARRSKKGRTARSRCEPDRARRDASSDDADKCLFLTARLPRNLSARKQRSVANKLVHRLLGSGFAVLAGSIRTGAIALANEGAHLHLSLAPPPGMRRPRASVRRSCKLAGAVGCRVRTRTRTEAERYIAFNALKGSVPFPQSPSRS